MKHQYLKLSLLFLLIITIHSCKDDPVKPPDPGPQSKITISAEDVSCTEAWLKFSMENISFPVTIKLFKDTVPVKLFSGINSADHFFSINSLLPGKTYVLKAEILDAENKITGIFSEELNLVTLDTTSVNFSWQSWEFGNYGYSALWDVEIINENSIWAVGEIYYKDSLDNYEKYNAVHWNGVEWELKKIDFYTICGQPDKGPWPSSSIFRLQDNTIYVSGGDQIAVIKDDKQTALFCNPWRYAITKIWCTNSGNIYAVGNSGFAAHFNGSTWTKIETGTTVDLKDIFGTEDGRVIWIAGGKVGETVFIKIEDGKLSKIYEGSSFNQINGRYVGNINSVWTKNRFMTYYINPGWGELNVQKTEDESLDPQYFAEMEFFVNRMRGLDHNRIFVAGDEGKIGFFNGVNYNDIYNHNHLNMWYAGLGVSNSIVVSVGQKFYDVFNAKAIITMGKQ